MSNLSNEGTSQPSQNQSPRTDSGDGRYREPSRKQYFQTPARPEDIQKSLEAKTPEVKDRQTIPASSAIELDLSGQQSDNTPSRPETVAGQVNRANKTQGGPSGEPASTGLAAGTSNDAGRAGAKVDQTDNNDHSDGKSGQARDASRLDTQGGQNAGTARSGAVGSQPKGVGQPPRSESESGEKYRAGDVGNPSNKVPVGDKSPLHASDLLDVAKNASGVYRDRYAEIMGNFRAGKLHDVVTDHTAAKRIADREARLCDTQAAKKASR